MYVRKGTELASLILGGDQERGRRASTQNIAGIVGLARAVEICLQKMDEEIKVQTGLRDRLLNEVPKRIEGVKVNGHLSQRLPNNAHFSFDRIEGESLL
ncbi:MAG: cysteine desulfurase NifS, partial [Candidatus Omnitrophica bacterium]|nr:cysteine desulfurase NifS [Candidatus Omnitrophota bacterium]